MARKTMMLLLMVMLSACANYQTVNNAISRYNEVADRVRLGMSKNEVLEILSPTQAALPDEFAKPVEQYVESGKHRTIYFFRSRVFNDGIVTDDEFTPYVFEEDVLIAIGWTAIGGPKTQGQVRDAYDRFRIHYGIGVHHHIH